MSYWLKWLMSFLTKISQIKIDECFSYNIIYSIVNYIVQDFEDEEFVRTLPKCGHFFHLVCIDKWLVQQGSCPICRINYVPHL